MRRRRRRNDCVRSAITIGVGRSPRGRRAPLAIRIGGRGVSRRGSDLRWRCRGKHSWRKPDTRTSSIRPQARASRAHWRHSCSFNVAGTSCLSHRRSSRISGCHYSGYSSSSSSSMRRCTWREQHWCARSQRRRRVALAQGAGPQPAWGKGAGQLPPPQIWALHPRLALPVAQP